MAFRADLPIDDTRLAVNRQLTWHSADGENGPAARSFAADAHECIMVGSKRTYRDRYRMRWDGKFGKPTSPQDRIEGGQPMH